MIFLRKITLLSALLSSICFLQAQHAKDYFLQMPDSLLPYLTKVNKEDMPDFINSNMAAKVKNRLHATTEMKQMTEDYIEIETSISSTFQLKVLPLADSAHILAVVTTVKAPAADSWIRFFTPEWVELPSGDFFTPLAVEDFMFPVETLIEAEKTEEGDSIKQLEVFTEEQYQIALNYLKQTRLFYYYFTPEDTSMRIVFTTPTYLEDQSKRYIRKDPIALPWENKRFVHPEN